MTLTTRYYPQPIDTSEVVLPKAIEELVEQLAENTHECWAALRKDEGWTYGEERDDTLKLNPCLIPYGDLTDRERACDRTTAMETLRLIVKLGFRIEANS